MKILIAILSVYICSIALIPCGDEIGHSDISASSVATSDDCSDDIHDLCTPICTCGCCGIALPCHFHNIQSKTIIVFYNTRNIESPSFYNSSYQSSVWHPPLIS